MAIHFPYKVGFLGSGNLAQSMIRRLLESKVVPPHHVFASNRSPGKLAKVVEQFGIQSCATNEELIDECDIVILGMKPQDLMLAIEPLVPSFQPNQIVVSLAAGLRLSQLQKKIPQCRFVRVMANTPANIGKGVIGYYSEEDDESANSMIEDLFSPLGFIQQMETEEHLDALTVACASGPGFIFELMMYWADWIEERGFDAATAREMTIQTFLGASLLADLSKDISLEDLQAKVTSKKGVTAAGLQSMRELEIERTLRYSFEKAALRNEELAKES